MKPRAMRGAFLYAEIFAASQELEALIVPNRTKKRGISTLYCPGPNPRFYFLQI
jgi:hypothetical protein